MSLSRTAKQIKNLIEENGYTISDHKSYIILDNFYNWFHDNIFNYYCSPIIQHLNNITHAIRRYFAPTLEKHTQQAYLAEYNKFYDKIIIPKTISTELGQYCFNNLASTIRSQPNLPLFEIPDGVCIRY